MARKIPKRVFVVDDDPAHNDMLKQYLLEKFNVEVTAFTNGADALRNMDLQPSYVILDYYLDRDDPAAPNGLEILKQLHEKHPDTNVIMLSAQDKIEVAVDSMKYGAYDYVVKNPTGFLRVENIMNHIHRLLRDRQRIRTYRISTFVLGLVLTLIVTMAVVLKITGIATDDVGW